MSHHRSRRDFLRFGAGLGLGYWLTEGFQADNTRTAAAAAPGASAADQAAPPASRTTVYIMTDLEGVAGVIDSENWCKPESRYYELAKEFLTLEVNAAIEGFARGGATDFLVADGHGYGAIHPKLLDRRAQLARNWSPPYPFSLEKGMDFAAWVGQHAMSRTELAHLAHTGSFSVYETTINGIAVGEFGEMVFCASQLGTRTIFGSGDLAFAKEAQALVPGIETVAVKRGTIPGRGDECNAESYAQRNLAAIHCQPERAREMILAGAERAIRRAKADTNFGIVRLKAPLERVAILRKQGDQPKRIGRASHPDDVIALMNSPLKYEPLRE
ncbi:MAG: M55 family metallopeptidase [Pirellulales bacterium]|nr:M55 family metallopeptidase [Pirellulales bacterium]